MREKKIFVQGSPEIAVANTRVYLDIEGTPQDRTYYLIGAHVVSNGIESSTTFWADTASPADQMQIFEDLLLHLSKYADYTVLHFGSYERVALRRMKTRMGERYSKQIEEVLRRMVNVLSLITEHVYFPTYSNSLKDIGSFLGHQWFDASSSGLQTLVWRSTWLTDHHPSSKEKLTRYNQDDCLALRTVAEFLEWVAASNPAAPLRDRSGTEVVRTDALLAKKDGLFGKTNYVLDDFRAINRLSYFDYQRDKVFAQATKHRKKTSDRAKRNPPKPNKTVIHRAARCPRCHSREIRSLSHRTNDVVDIKFTRNGVKRWITRHITWRYRCARCGHTLLPACDRGRRQLPRYGRGLIGWCMYQLLIGGQNINRINRSLAELFGLSVPKTSVYLFKQAVAAYFKAGYERILSDLLSGSLIHIDETTINLRKEKGYVWVLASANSVYFFYRKSREGSFLGSMLRKFKGVLVSDFFTAYDALDVPQQRCLVHLMRDVNEDLLKRPFDEELKSIAVRFSALVKEIVLTIDKYGLKRRHLNKHTRSASSFCRWVTEENFTSEIARGYARRVGKYKDYLFQFLEHDGVPWNNTSAEHAIKSFAKFRRSSNGVATEETIRDYLVILSICLTCEYRGISFLEVLLGTAKGDFGFGPKRNTLIWPRQPRNDKIPQEAREKPATDTLSTGSGDRTLSCEGPRVVSLNRVLPSIFERFRRSLPRFQYSAALAADLWPVKIYQRDLESAVSAFVYILGGETGEQALMLSARNLRIDKPDISLGLSGRYVAVSISDGGRRTDKPPRATHYAKIPRELERNISLGQACLLAKKLGGAARACESRTGRKCIMTEVTMYIPQYLPGPNGSCGFRAGRATAKMDDRGASRLAAGGGSGGR